MSSKDPSLLPGHLTLDTIAALFAPLARLAMAHGVTVTLLEEALRRALVQAVRAELLAQGLPEHRLVSRISAGTGLTRREVMRLSQALAQRQPDVKGSPAAEVFTRWVSHSRWPKVLRRAGGTRSFDALARSVTQDVHPRTLLDELSRLRLVDLSEDGESVERLKDAFVPGDDAQQMLDYLAANVGGHLSGAVSNVIGAPGPRHFDQAVFADELSERSILRVQDFVTAQWQRLLREAVPLLEARIEEDRQAGEPQTRRMRIGLYTYEDGMALDALPVKLAKAVKTTKATKATKTAGTAKTADKPGSSKALKTAKAAGTMPKPPARKKRTDHA